LSRAVDAYMGKPLAVLIGNPKKESRSSLEARVRKVLPDLKPDVITKIVSQRSKSIKRLSNCVEAIKDNLIASTPENVRHFQEMSSYKKLIHWAYSLGAHDTDRVVKQWKKFSALLKWCATRSVTDAPPFPEDFPGYGRHWVKPNELPPLWCELTPWLRSVVENGVCDKTEATRLCHLTTSRSMPAGGHRTRESSLRKHAETLCKSQVTTTVERAEILRRLSYFIGRTVDRLRPQNAYSAGHTSLTSSA